MFEAIVIVVIATAEVVSIVHQNREDARHAQQFPAQSWDQANLKRNDAGCPTAIYVAPAGNLEECP